MQKVLVATIAGLVVGSAVTALVIGRGNTPVATDHNQVTTDKLRNLKGDDFDKAFIEEMIVHHEGAIDMARLIVANAKHDEIKQLGQDIISAQSKEIDMMQTWQGDWGYKTVPRSHNEHQQ